MKITDYIQDGFTYVNLIGFKIMGVPFIVTVEVQEIDRREHTMYSSVFEIEPLNEKTDGDYFNNFKSVIYDAANCPQVAKAVAEYLGV